MRSAHAGAARPTAVRFSAAPARDVRSGLLGFVSFALGTILVDGVAVRKTRDGRLALSFPQRTDARGHRHPIVRPLDDSARRELERQILAAIGLDHDHDREEAYP